MEKTNRNLKSQYAFPRMNSPAVKVKVYIKMFLAKSINYIIPQGEHRVRILNATHTIKPDGQDLKDEVRITYTLPDLKDPLVEYRAGRTYKEAEAMELRQDLFTLAGDNLDEFIDDDGNLRNENLDLLRGKECFITAEQIRNPKHPKPFIKIYNLRKSRKRDGLN